VALNKEKTPNCPFIVKEYPIHIQVVGQQTIKLNIPIEIPADYKPKGDASDVTELNFVFVGHKGNFGQEFSVKVRVQEGGESEEVLFRAAITLAEAGMGSFDECVHALRVCNLDENAALQMLVD